VIAFLPTLGPRELCLLLVIGLLLIAHELPEAGSSLGRLAARMTRGLR